MRATIIVACVGALVLGSGVAAQGELEPEHIGDTLPSAAIFGEGWTTQGSSFIPHAFDQRGSPVVAARGQFYTGERGGRALVDVVMPGNTLRDAREAWDEMADWVSRIEQHTFDDATMSSWELDELEPPEGCVDSLRAEGYSYIDSAEVGATLCDTGEGYYIYVMVSGNLQNSGIRYQHHTASDMVVSAMLGHGPLARRIATPAA